MISHYFNFLLKLSSQAWIEISLPFLFILLAFLIHKYLSFFRGRYILYFILLVLFMRSVLFYNPFSWAVYKSFLPLETIDWRQYDELTYESLKYLKPHPDMEILAVGASATAVTYKFYAKKHHDLQVFSMAGLSPLDLYTFRDEILRLKPKVILLNLSELDMARKPELASSNWSPFTFKDIKEIKSIIDTTRYFNNDDKQFPHNIFIGKFLPELKYSFIFRNLLDRVLHEQERGTVAHGNIPDSAALKIHMKEISELSEEYIPFHTYYLDKSIKFLNDNHIPVVLIEGQYNPLAYNERNLKLKLRVRKIVQDILGKNSLNNYVIREQLYQFTGKDYVDGYHVKPESGLVFSEYLIKHVKFTQYSLHLNQ